MPARTNSAAHIAPEIAEAANFAAELITRTLKLVAKEIETEEQSPSPDIKKCAECITTIKRAADALKALATFRTTEPTAFSSTPAPIHVSTPEPSHSRETSAPAEAVVPTPTLPPPTVLDPTTPTPGRSLASNLAGLVRMRKSLHPPATTRSYGEHLSRR